MNVECVAPEKDACDGNCGKQDLVPGWDTPWSVIDPGNNELFFCSPVCINSWLSEVLAK